MTLYDGATDYQWTMEESMDYYLSIGEDNFDLWGMKFRSSPPFMTDPLPSTRGYETAHKTTKTKKKSDKQKMKEERAKGKSRRIDVIFDLIPNEAPDQEEWDEIQWRKVYELAMENYGRERRFT